MSGRLERVREQVASLSVIGLLAEFLMVVTGIIVALGIDNWRQDREELAIAKEHLRDVAAEIRGNIGTLERVAEPLEYKRQALEIVLRFLSDPEANKVQPDKLLQAFAAAAASAVPWLRDSQFQALAQSGHLRLLRDPELADRLGDIYAAPGVLYSQVDALRGSFPAVVVELLPAGLQSSLNPLAFYVPRSIDAPVIADNVDTAAVLEQILSRREALLRLARNEAAVYTANWYVQRRLQLELEEMLDVLEP